MVTFKALFNSVLSLFCEPTTHAFMSTLGAEAFKSKNREIYVKLNN